MIKEADLKQHNERQEKLLKGKTVKQVRYLTDEEMKAMMWDKRPIAIQFDDGTVIVPMQDDEGNEGGSIYIQKPDGGQDTIYTC